MKIDGLHVEDIKDDVHYKSHLSLADPTDPFSIINMVTPRMRVAMKRIPETLWQMDERELREIVSPTAILEKLRLNFYEEYARAVTNRRMVNMHNVTRNVTYREYLYESVFNQPENLCWMLRPPADLVLAQKYVLGLVYKRLEDYVSMTPMIETTVTTKLETIVKKKIDTDALRFLRETAVWLETRLRGGAFPRETSVPRDPLPKLNDECIAKDQTPALTELEHPRGKKVKKVHRPEAVQTETKSPVPSLKTLVNSGSFSVTDDAPETEHEAAEFCPELGKDDVDLEGGLEPGDVSDGVEAEPAPAEEIDEFADLRSHDA